MAPSSYQPGKRGILITPYSFLTPHPHSSSAFMLLFSCQHRNCLTNAFNKCISFGSKESIITVCSVSSHVVLLISTRHTNAEWSNCMTDIKSHHPASFSVTADFFKTVGNWEKETNRIYNCVISK